MEPRKIKIFAAAGVIILLISTIVILWHSLGGISTTFFILLGIDLAVIIAIITWLIFQLTVVDRRHTAMAHRSVLEGEELRLEYSYLRKVAGLPARFHFEILQAATDNFQTLVGRGSSASVFKGVLNDGTVVAVKRIEVSAHGESEFRAEVAAIASVQHVSLVRLLGYCISPSRFLVYEFAHNGSLDKWIFPRAEGHHSHQCLPWPVRYRIAVDVAKALAYLHEDCRQRVLHLDVKPENILLDEKFRAIVSDFGLSRLMGKDESRIVTTVRGTRGYLAPEWFVGTGISEKCDIFSFGMVLLELVAGRRSVQLLGGEWSYLPRVVMEKAERGKLMEVADERLAGVADEREVRTVLNVAMCCLREEAKKRPKMAEVVDMLQGRVAVEMPPAEARMLILDLLVTEDHESMHHRRGGAGGGGAETRRTAALTPVGSTYSIGMSSILSGR